MASTYTSGKSVVNNMSPSYLIRKVIRFGTLIKIIQSTITKILSFVTSLNGRLLLFICSGGHLLNSLCG